MHLYLIYVLLKWLGCASTRDLKHLKKNKTKKEKNIFFFVSLLGKK